MELIGECPTENADRVSKRLSEIMLGAALPEVTTPMKCDIEVTKKWYENDYGDIIKKELGELMNANKLTIDQATEKIINEHTECTREELLKIINKGE